MVRVGPGLTDPDPLRGLENDEAQRLAVDLWGGPGPTSSR